jgi:autotransporter-associated beta strand protein
VRIKINAPECPLSRFYSDLGLLPWSKTGDFGEKRAKPDSLLASNFYLNNGDDINSFVRLAAINADRTVTYTRFTVGGPSVSLVWGEAGGRIGGVLGLGNANSTHTLIWASGLDLNGGAGSQRTRTIDAINGSAGIGGAISGVISDSGTTKAIFNKSGAGTLVLSAVNSYSGPTTISGGILQLGNGITDGSISASSAITNNAALVYQLVGSQTYGGVISGTGTLTKSGAGVLTLSGANTFTGKTTLSGGTLSINSFGNVGAASSALGAPTSVANGTIDFTASSTLTYTGPATSSDRVLKLAGGGATFTHSGTGLVTLTGGITGTNNSMLFRGLGDITEAGLVAHSGSVSRTDPGTLYLTNPGNSFPGNLLVFNGTIRVSSVANSGSNSAAGSGSTIFLGQNGAGSVGQGTLQFTGTSGGSTNRSLVIQNGALGGGAASSKTL